MDISQLALLNGLLSLTAGALCVISVRLALVLWCNRRGLEGADVFDLCRCFAFIGAWLFAVGVAGDLLPEEAHRFGPPLYWTGWLIGMMIYLWARWTQIKGKHPFQRTNGIPI